jgi:Tol biopolymer transport system component
LDAGQHDGSPYLVFELLEGRTLRECLREGSVAPRRAADWAAQIAHGLAAAHDKGIVHRDLKPENLFVLPEGRVKVLDFGLAKLAPAADSPGGSAATESLLTRPGTILGTVAYMSPEQVRSAGVDARSDLFALGVVLYEMLAGRRPWSGETTAETIAAILKEDPPELSGAGLAIPTGLERIVRRCLEKDPAARFHSAHDLAFALETVKTGSDSRPDGGAVVPPRPVWRSQAALALGALALGALVATGAAHLLGSARHVAVPLPSFEQITFRRGSVFSARFASDGDTIVYAAAWEGGPSEVFLARRGSAESRPLGFAPANLLALSSSGEMALSLEPRNVLSWLHPGVLALAPLGGGAARRLLPDVNAADWAPDGQELAVARVDDKGGSRIEWPPGKLAYQTAAIVSALRVSPDGSRLACIESRDEAARLVLIERGGIAKELAAGWEAPSPGLAWSPDGRRVYFSVGRLARSPMLSVVDLHGSVRPVLELPGGLRLEDVSRDGRVMLAHIGQSLRLRVGSADSENDRDHSWFTHPLLLDVSRDGQRLLFRELRTGEREVPLYLRDVHGGMAVRIGSGFSSGALSPDGNRVAAVSSSQDRLTVLPVREGETVELPKGTIRRFGSLAWPPDGKHLLFLAADADGQRAFEQDIEGGVPHPLTAPIAATTFCPSPEGGRFVASDGRHLVIYSLDGGPTRDVPGEHVDHSLVRWSSDGRSVFSYRTDDLPGRLYRIDLSSGVEQVVRTLMPPDPAGVWRISPVVVTPDGRTWAYTALQTLSNLYVYTGLQ